MPEKVRNQNIPRPLSAKGYRASRGKLGLSLAVGSSHSPNLLQGRQLRVLQEDLPDGR